MPKAKSRSLKRQRCLLVIPASNPQLQPTRSRSPQLSQTRSCSEPIVDAADAGSVAVELPDAPLLTSTLSDGVSVCNAKGKTEDPIIVSIIVMPALFIACVVVLGVVV
jgi:hypothetical protein